MSVEYHVLDETKLTEITPDNEFTQLMKGLQGERLRQAFKYLDKDEDGFIRPDQFKQIILVCRGIQMWQRVAETVGVGNCRTQTFGGCRRQAPNTLHAHSWTTYILFGSYCIP